MAEEARFDRAVIDDILTRLRPIAGRPFVVALDGPGGSGKSTLARELAEAYDGASAVVEGDDFYADLADNYRAGLDPAGGYREYFDWRRLRDQVLIPARQGRPFEYQRYDWGEGRLGDWVAVPQVAVLFVDGVYSSRPELRESADLVLWVTTREAKRLRRQLTRGQNDSVWIQRWMAAENYYLERIHQPGSADVVILGEDLDHPPDHVVLKDERRPRPCHPLRRRRSAAADCGRVSRAKRLRPGPFASSCPVSANRVRSHQSLSVTAFRLSRVCPGSCRACPFSLEWALSGFSA
ncbi:MAG TPA: hypothetical protein VHZ33_19020 [Trebonia sp.]|nr:hypothetical protein [Trebonia sp.]